MRQAAFCVFHVHPLLFISKCVSFFARRVAETETSETERTTATTEMSEATEMSEVTGTTDLAASKKHTVDFAVKNTTDLTVSKKVLPIL